MAAVRTLLAGRDRWLIVFDNAQAADDVRDWIPQGPGHVIITSRSPAWVGVAVPLPVALFARVESIALLTAELPDLAPADADRLAEALGDLPLALVQAGGVMAETGMPSDEYLAVLDATAGPLLDTAPSGDPEHSRRPRR